MEKVMEFEEIKRLRTLATLWPCLIRTWTAIRLASRIVKGRNFVKFYKNVLFTKNNFQRVQKDGIKHFPRRNPNKYMVLKMRESFKMQGILKQSIEAGCWNWICAFTILYTIRTPHLFRELFLPFPEFRLYFCPYLLRICCWYSGTEIPIRKRNIAQNLSVRATHITLNRPLQVWSLMSDAIRTSLTLPNLLRKPMPCKGNQSLGTGTKWCCVHNLSTRYETV